MNSPLIAIVGMACEYPDARSPVALWENVLAQRQAFRRLPAERLEGADYFAADPEVPDRTYSLEAAVIEGFVFDRLRFRVGGESFRSTDLAHWLALDVTARALEDAGFPDGDGLPRETSGVFLGNTLTGEFSRASTMCLRWPFVRRVVESHLSSEQWTEEERRAFLARLESTYKQPFPPVGEDSLAGGLSNTIAGRICNFFDLKGGGFTVDGACASSLLAVAQSCTALVAGDLDLVIAGGVDLSLDPFELVGFSKVGALARQQMRVFDSRSHGFWPGEGCGVLVLMRAEDAAAQGRKPVTWIRGWGISSDGHGGITRPEVEGQVLALRRAYRRAGIGIDSVDYFEAHGTGTELGDTTELQALLRARREAAVAPAPAALGSVKANIGHTKAAAGAAGLIKAAMALQAEVLPPTTGCEQPHGELLRQPAVLRVLREGEPWPPGRPLRAGVSAMGFGGINAHVVLEGRPAGRTTRTRLTPRARLLLASFPDAELFLLGARDHDSLVRQVNHLRAIAPLISRAEVTDLAACLAEGLDDRTVRAAVVASSPQELGRRLDELHDRLAQGSSRSIDPFQGIFLGSGDNRARLGFLFSGQGVKAPASAGVYRRFPVVRSLYEDACELPADAGLSTAAAQPAIARASLAALRVLEQLGVSAGIAIGHSLGELTALHWAGVLDADVFLLLAQRRGQIMSAPGPDPGAMASIGASAEIVADLLDGDPVVIAGVNSTRQTIISGERAGIERVMARASGRGWPATRLAVSHAFHSPLMAHVVPLLSEELDFTPIGPPTRDMISTISGNRLGATDDVRALLCRQLVSPVRFLEAMDRARDSADFWIEVGPGRVLTDLASQLSEAPVAATEACGDSLAGLLQAVGTAFALGVPLDHKHLFADRFSRRFDLDWKPRFFASPCEQVPKSDRPESLQTRARSTEEAAPATSNPSGGAAQDSALELIRRLVAERVELPESSVGDHDRFLHDLHLNSITVGQLMAQAARRLNLDPPLDPTHYATATVAEAALALEDQARVGSDRGCDDPHRPPPGIDSWVRSFRVELVETRYPAAPLRGYRRTDGDECWQVVAPEDLEWACAWGEALSREVGGQGVLLVLPPGPLVSRVRLLLQGAKALVARLGIERFVLVQSEGGGAAFAKTVALEYPHLATCVVDLPWEHPRSLDWLVSETRAAVGYTEVHYDHSGCRRVPVLRVLPASPAPLVRLLGPDDVLFATGGGKGITAECALALARGTGVRLALMGRSDPDCDPALAANLDRMLHFGIRVTYVQGDVANRGAVASAVRLAERAQGTITAILHGAGRNVPRLLADLDEKEFLRTLGPKVQGAHNLLEAIDPGRLKLFVVFGSIIARTGMRGEADYAVANEWLTSLAGEVQTRYRQCRCLAVEWSAWSGIGMAESLGRVDALLRQGITPISLEQGISMLRELLNGGGDHVAVVVAGRFGLPPTLLLDQRPLPLLRFLEHPRASYPGIELVADSVLAPETDPYLDDHLFHGERLFPAVLGLEAMAQAARALTGGDRLPVFTEVRFHRPITVPGQGSSRIRLAALARDTYRIDLAVRSEETAYQVDHFNASCRSSSNLEDSPSRAGPTSESDFHPPPAIPLDPGADLYGDVLFHAGRFQRIRGYRRLKARECLAEIAPAEECRWFGEYQPRELLLGDPGARDAVIHAIQACIPHATVLPIAVDRIVPCKLSSECCWFVRAWERFQEDNELVYDVEVLDPFGMVHERWDGLRLRIVAYRSSSAAWPASLVGPYLERRIGEIVPGVELSVEVERSEGARRDPTDRTIHRALGQNGPIVRSANGAPESLSSKKVSSAHGERIQLAVAGKGPIGCDLEPVCHRPRSTWQDLLGADRLATADLLIREEREDLDLAATRLWVSIECLKKAGLPTGSPLLFEEAKPDGWVVLRSGSLLVATVCLAVREHPGPLVLGVLVSRDNASLRVPTCHRV
jgi:enediyne polyketide synthase